jgi:hypothetical protein
VTDLEYVIIDRMEARHVLWHFREPGGIEPGNFVTALLAAMAAADPGNLRRLASGFPGYAAGMALAMQTRDGIEILQARAGVQLCPTCTGAGHVQLTEPVMEGGHLRYLATCPDCRGRGAT